MLGGGGAGRTTASLKMIMAYLGYVVVLNEHLKRIEDDRRNYLRGPQSKKKDKEGSDTLDSPAVTNTDEQLSAFPAVRTTARSRSVLRLR